MARATSIISTSGAGASLEARIAGTLLAAMIAEANWPGGDPAQVIERVEFQRADPAAGFDDLHVHSREPTGGLATAYLQIKRTLNGERSEKPFKRPVGDAAGLLAAGAQAEAQFFIVASRSEISPRDVDRARDAARLSVDSADFWRRWSAPGASSDTERDYTSAVAWVVEQEVGHDDPDLAWRVIARLGVTVLDVDLGESQAIGRAVDQLQGALAFGDRGQAFSLFEALCQFAEDAAKVAGGVDRPALLAEFSPRYPLASAPSARACVERIAADAGAALAGVRNDIAGVRLPRSRLVDELATAMAEVRALRLGGDAGSGKSAVLRTLAERQRDGGAGLIVLKFDRLVARSWAEHASALQVTTPLPRLIAELAAGGSGLLVLDGLDRMLEAGFGGLVGEICAAIEASPSGRHWRCIASSRDGAGPEPSLHYPLLRELKPCTVGAPTRDELAVLTEAFPHLPPLMARRGFAELNRNLFFIDQMARNPSVAGASSELDLIRAWAGRGAAESPRHPTRDATLRALGEARLGRPYAPLSKPADDDGLARLASEGTVVMTPYRDVVTFGHDIYEDWAVARALDSRRSEVPSILLAAGQPLAWMRSVRLVAETAAETDGAAGWLAFHDLLRVDTIDPLWRRIALTAVLYSPRGRGALDALEAMLLEDGGALMADLLDTLLTLEVRPHPYILQSADYDHLDAAGRRSLALRLPVPRLAPWYEFLSWSVGRWSAWPKSLVPKLARVTLTWLRFTDRDEGPTAAMVAQCVAWLRELDVINAMSFDNWRERSRLLREMGADRDGSADPVGDLLRLVVARGAAAATDEVDAYLADLLASGRREGSEFVETPGAIPDVLPGRFVDLVIATMIMRHDPDAPLDYAVEQSDGIGGRSLFFPSSPRRAGFDQLFAADEDQALRLLSAMSAAAAAVWRRREARRGRTVRPLRLAMGGVEVELWGDEHVYKWVTGLLGPNLLGSLFLAADAWMADQVGKGRALEELCGKVLRSSHLVASASLCLAAAKTRATSAETLRHVLPLLLAPRLWSYDLRLSLEIRSGGGFGIGWRRGDEEAYRAALAVRQRRTTQYPLVEGLIAPLHAISDEGIAEVFASGVYAWSVEDLANIDEELSDDEALADLEDELASWRAKADPANWNVEAGPDEGSFSLGYTPPEPLSERAATVQEHHEAIEESGALIEWAFGHGTSGVTPNGQTFAQALPIAKAMDEPDLFEHALDIDPTTSVKCRGVAAVAAALATHGDAEAVAQELPWLLSVFARSAAIDHGSDPILYEESLLDDDAAASAARGLGALTMRGMAGGDQERIWLGLVASSFRGIARAALEPACAFASLRPAAARAAFRVSADSMLYAWVPFALAFEQRMKTNYAERCLGAVDAALLSLSSDEAGGPEFPRPITERFQGGDASNPCAGDPATQFDHYRASAVWERLDVRALGADAGLRDLLVGYFSDAIVWYGSYLKFQDGGFGSISRAMKWERALGGIAGRLALLVDPAEAARRFIEPAAAIGDRKARSDVLSSILEALGRDLVDKDLPLDAAFEAIWRAAARPIFDAAHSEGSRRYDPEETPLTAAAFAQYNYPVFPAGWPRAPELVVLLNEWVAECARYRFAASVIRTLIGQAGMAFIPLPGLDWLEAILEAHRTTDAEEWRSQIGPPAGDILATLWGRCRPDDRRFHVVRFRAAAARLADRGVASAAELLSEIAIVQSSA